MMSLLSQIHVFVVYILFKKLDQNHICITTHQLTSISVKNTGDILPFSQWPLVLLAKRRMAVITLAQLLNSNNDSVKNLTSFFNCLPPPFGGIISE